ncbi:MAG: hypothetical protein JO211_17570, partial [Acidobacteriaceae bacterium]|nr:hypothetical protein [Acidobacteriaceae bacterium]
RAVVAGWAPYHYGHWAWIDPWGWTWVDDAPWGFAPFHYGRWAFISGRWGWCPGPIVVGYRGPVVRPYYAPALVAWFGGAHWGVSVSVGGPSLGWVALGFGEVFTPPYVCSRGYFTNVNVYNTRIVERVNITNVYNTVYVNHAVYNREFVNVRAPGAVMAMRQDAFASGRPIRESGFAVRQTDVVRMQSAAVITPGVAPTRQALAVTMGRPAAHPPAQIVQRQVVARNAPPPAPAPFAARQQYLQQHVGDLHNYQAMHQAVAAQARPVAYVRQAPAVQPVAVHAGQRVGNAGSFHAQAPISPAPAHGAPPNRPAVTPGSGGGANAGNFRAQTQTAPPPSHGTPPNVRGGYNSQPAANARVPERAAQPQPAPSRPEARAENHPEARTPQPPPARPAARTEARTPQPPPARPEARTPQPPPARPEARTPQPPPARPEARTPQPPPARPAEHNQPVHEARPAPAPQEHRAPPPQKNEKDTKEHH